VDVPGVPVRQPLVAAFIPYIPRLLAARAIVLGRLPAGNILWRATLLAAVNAQVPTPRVLAGVARALVLILAGAMALDQIAVARTIVFTAFAISFGAVMLGLAIAFGIGGGGVARRLLERQFPDTPSPPSADEPSHL
jgi:hypothetical protein